MGLFDPSLSHGGGAPANGRGAARGPSLEFRLLILGPIYLAAIVGAVLAGFFVYYTATIPNPMALRQKENAPIVRILARDGSVLAERGGAAPYIPIDLLPRHLIDAVLAIEDRRFFSHRGVDPTGLGRAILTNLKAGRVVQGGSTITQQLAKNMFLSSERTLLRKLEELVLALWLEMRLSKPDILELYLNRVYFGGGAYGVESAARRFFNKGAQEVTMARGRRAGRPAEGALANTRPPGTRRLPASGAQGVLAKMVEAGLRLADRRGPQLGGDGALCRAAGHARRDRRRICRRRGARSPARPDRRQRPRDHRRDHHRPRPAAARTADRARSARQRRAQPGCEPGGAGAARHGGRHHRAGGRPLLRREPVQPCAQGTAPARLRLQAVRLSGGAGSGPDARQHRPRPADPHQGLEPQQRRRPLSRRRDAARRAGALDQHGCRAPAT